MLQQHLDAVNRPGSDARTDESSVTETLAAETRVSVMKPSDTSPAEELLQHHVGDRRGQDADPDGEQFPSHQHRGTESFEHI